MAVTTVGTSSLSIASSASGANITLTKPTGVLANDLLIAVFGLNGGANPTWTPPTGWTQQYTFIDLAIGAVFYRVADGTEGSSFAFGHTESGAIDGAAGIIALRGCDTTTPILANSTFKNQARGTAWSCNAVSWTGAADAISLLIAPWQDVTATVTWPSGYDQSPDGFTNNDGFQWITIATNLTTQSAVTSIAAQSWTMSAGVYGDPFQLAIKVAAAGGGTSFPAGYGWLGKQQQNAVYRM